MCLPSRNEYEASEYGFDELVVVSAHVGISDSLKKYIMHEGQAISQPY